VSVWVVDSGQRLKHWLSAHGSAKLTALSQDHSEMHILTGASDGTVKVLVICFFFLVNFDYVFAVNLACYNQSINQSIFICIR